MYTNRMFGTAKCVFSIELSSFQGVLIREVPHTCMLKVAKLQVCMSVSCMLHTFLMYRHRSEIPRNVNETF